MGLYRNLGLIFNNKNMKKIFYTLIIFASIILLKAQLLSNMTIAPNIVNSNVFLDGSTNFSIEAGALPYSGKGMIIPSVDLINFEFDLTLADGATFPTYFDGMVVYNRSTGATLTTGVRSSTVTMVSPGYYYFFNPNGYTAQNVTGGKWRPIGDPRVIIGVSETPTNTIVISSQIFAVKGQFVVTAGNTTITLANPAGISSLYRITIYKDGLAYANSLYSYNKSTGAAVTGSPGISSTYPAGTYDYTLEYLK